MSKNNSLQPKKLTFIMLKKKSPKLKKITLLDYLQAKFGKEQVVIKK